MHTASKELDHYRKVIEHKIYHTYLHQYILRPHIDEQKLLFLVTAMNKAELKEKTRERYIVTTTLVQMALDTHDLVPTQNTPDEPKTGEIEKQLTILAGDFYSGLYYFLLAELNDFAMIKTLAGAIKDINEYKMKLYYHGEQSIQDSLSTIEDMESVLFVRVMEFLQQGQMDHATKKWLFIHKLKQEQENIRNNFRSPLFEMLLSDGNKGENTDESLLNTLDAIIQSETALLHGLLHHNTASCISKDILYQYITDVGEG